MYKKTIIFDKHEMKKKIPTLSEQFQNPIEKS